MTRRLTILGLLLTISLSQSLLAAEQKTQADPTQKTLSQEERAYDEKVLKLSDQISAKIAEIQKKDKDIENEVYPAYVPELKADRERLQKQLDDLNMQKTQLEAQKTSQEMSKNLENP